MFARVKKSGRYQYLQVVENRGAGAKTVQRVICTVGRLDQLHAKGSIETLIRSLSRFSEKVLLILSGKSDVSSSAKKIREMQRRSPQDVSKTLSKRGYFFERKDLFTGLDMVFFDTTSIYFEREEGVTIGRKGHGKNHRPDLNQMVVGAVIANKGKPVCCEMWPGNTTDVKTLVPEIDRIRSRFHIAQCCIVADRGMISAETLKERDERKSPYILGTTIRKVKEIKYDVLSHPGRYREVRPEGNFAKDPAPFKVKKVFRSGKRYIVCLNPKQAPKDDQHRQTIIDSLQEKVKTNIPKADWEQRV